MAEVCIKHYQKLIEEKKGNTSRVSVPFRVRQYVKLASITILLVHIVLRLMFRNPIGPNSVTSFTHYLIGLNIKIKSYWSRHFVTSFFGSRHSKT
jgi:hypothetical protein